MLFIILFVLPIGIMSDARIWVLFVSVEQILFAILNFAKPCSCHGNAGWDKKSCGTFFLIRQWFSLVDKKRDNIFVAWQDTALAIPKPPSQIRVYIEQSSMSMSAHRLRVKEDRKPFFVLAKKWKDAHSSHHIPAPAWCPPQAKRCRLPAMTPGL